MDQDDALGDDEAHRPLLPPDDRLWRHPSEVAAHGLPHETEARAGPPRVWVVVGLAAVVSCMLTLGVVVATGGYRDRVRTVPAVEQIVLPAGTLPAPTEVTPGSTQAEIADRVRPAIVRLEVVRAGDSGTGSGVMFRTDGHLLTNHHVVVAADEISVVTMDGRRGLAHLVGADPATDVAVLKVDGWTDVPVVALGTAASLRVGQSILTIGEGRPAWTGQVRGLGRHLEREDEPTLRDLIETDSPVAPRASGSALVDENGAVVGIATAAGAATGGAATGYATPIDYARSVAEQLLATGTVVPAWIGVEGTDLDGAHAGKLGVDGGAVVTKVRDGSPAGLAGLQVEDVITSVDEVPVGGMGALRILLRSRRPGDVVTLDVIRETARRTIEVTLVERPAE
ncbi:MAG: S1C family serine protease [Acidimicrobiales bacterium]